MRLPQQSTPADCRPELIPTQSSAAVAPQGCGVFKAIACAAAVAACAGVCVGTGGTACAACFAGLGMGSCIECL